MRRPRPTTRRMRWREARTWLVLGTAPLLLGLAVLTRIPASAAPVLPPPAGVAATQVPATKTTTTTVPPTTTTTTTTQPAGPPVAGGIVPCPAGDVNDTCADLPCPTGQSCGSVVASPTVGLGSNQYVYLALSGVAPGDQGILVYYCADPGAATTLSSTTAPYCVASNTVGNEDGPQHDPAFPASSSTVFVPGTMQTSVQAGELSPPNTFTGEQFNVGTPTDSFSCDGSFTNPCAIVVTDTTINHSQISTAANSVVIPVSFAPPPNCPLSAASVTTESEFGIELLMPQVSVLTCGVAGAPVVANDTATDGPSAVADLANGAVQMAFTDDPESPDQQAALAKGNLALIPLALTANAVAFDAQLYQGGLYYPLTQMELTPTMAAGLLTNASNYGGTSFSVDDNDPCSGPSEAPGGGCASPSPCLGGAYGGGCSLYLQLNYLSGFNQFVQFTAAQRSDNTGATDQLFTWLCNAPIVPLDFGTNPTEKMSAAQELEVGLSAPNSPPVTTCPSGVDQVPVPAHASPQFQTAHVPNVQWSDVVKEMTGLNPGAAAGFADMNWAEARYYGMSAAALQNAAGTFVAPDAQSLDAAVSDATHNPDGSLTFHNLASDPAAYPMPSIIYAAIPKNLTPGPATDAMGIVLDAILSMTGAGAPGNSSLPQGFVPLPQSLTTQAQNDLATYLPVSPSTSPTSSNPGGGSPTSSGGQPTSTGGGSPGSAPNPYGTALATANGSTVATGSNVLGVSLPTFTRTGATAIPSRTGKGPKRRAGPSGPLLGPELPGYALVASKGSTLVTTLLGAGLLVVALGMLAMGGGLATRRRRPVVAADGDGDGDGEATGESGEPGRRAHGPPPERGVGAHSAPPGPDESDLRDD